MLLGGARGAGGAHLLPARPVPPAVQGTCSMPAALAFVLGLLLAIGLYVTLLAVEGALVAQ